MPFPKQAIKEILEGLDHANEALWTDDGAPVISEIQRLANDKTITRGQINEALPGFVRKSKDSVAEEVQPGQEKGDETGGVQAKKTTFELPAQPHEDEGSPEDEQARLRALAHQRVKDAEVAVTEAKNAVAEANRAVIMAEQRLTRAMNVYSSKYPPTTVAANIKQHLARQQEILLERVTGQKSGLQAGDWPIQQRMQDRKRDNGRKGNAPAPFLPRKSSISA
jgi:hypothetical protein